MTKRIVSDVLLDELLENADPALETEPAAIGRARRAMLRPSVNRVVKACRVPSSVASVADREAAKLRHSPTVLTAFREFVACVQDAM
ncbi:hypothetical protein KDX27_39140 [Burkholderia cenocepacia]|uniref:hypothetical protein n=1 Tax=Burkholderia cenocepacia TaxID=95486 RepID=UPI001B943B17|nr:hypothetical protein [Burkholderia cenocepacia]MBR8029916.1 hypothetical protein [Burkholderia cenocepacia]MBR8173708.1 hypothetical protein [Burkholderia cenocepacia]